jgi:hypothetical protein
MEQEDQDLLDLLRKKREELIAELSELQEFRQLQALDRVIAEYSGSHFQSKSPEVEQQYEPDEQLSQPEVELDEQQYQPARRKIHERRKSNIPLVIAAIEELQAVHPRRLNGNEIADLLSKRGLIVKHRDSASHISAALSSRKTIFNNVSGQGYGLVNPSINLKRLQLRMGQVEFNNYLKPDHYPTDKN